MHNIKSILIGLFLGILFLFSIILTVSILYENEVSQYLVEELNKQLLSEIKVDEINFTLLKKFPKASVEFKNVTAFSNKNYFHKTHKYNTDTLFFAKKLSVQTNLFDILFGKYIVRSLHFNQGQINLFINKKGQTNYIFWKTKKSNTNSDFKIDLNQVKFTNCDLTFYNEATRINLNTHVRKINLQGNFSRNKYTMKINSNIYINKLYINNTNYLFNRRVKLNTDFNILGKEIKISKGKLNLNNLNFILNGTIKSTKQQQLNLNISGNNLNIKTFAETLPYKIKKQLPSLNFKKGKVSLNMNITGKNIKINRPHINASFSVKEIALTYSKKKIPFSDLSFEGNFTNGIQNNAISSRLNFKKLNGNIQNNSFEGYLSLNNLKNPLVKFDITSDLFLNEIKHIFKIDTFDILKGFASSEVKYSGTYNNLLKFTFTDLFTKEYDINLSLSNGEIKRKDDPITISDINGNLEINKTLYSDNISFKINENDFKIRGQALGLYEYFNSGKTFYVNANLVSNQTDLNDLAPLFKTDKTTNTNSSYRFPNKLNLNLKVKVSSFKIGKFQAQNIKGILNYKPRVFSLHALSFRTMTGETQTNGIIIQDINNDFIVKTKCNLSNININTLFYSFNNFGQNFITNQNLKGNLSGDIFFTSKWTDKLKIYKKSIQSECNIKLINGELNNFKPLTGLSKFIELDELKNIQFSTLKNKITIKNEKIIIPQMDIASSVIKLTSSGEHSFNHNYEYHLSLLLSDLLSKKIKIRKNKKQSFREINEDDSGKIKLFLLLKGDKNDFNVKLDRKAARKRRKENREKERLELNHILKNEFNSNKKQDTTEEKFIIEWDEDDTSNN